MLCLTMSDTLPIHLIGWGATLAPLRLDNDTMCRVLGHPAPLAAQVEAMLGTRFRHTCMDFTTGRQIVGAADMATAAVRDALAIADLPPAALDAIFGASTLPDHSSPSLAVAVQKQLGLCGGPTFDVGGGCAAWGQALVLALQALSGGSARTVAVVAGETLTRHVGRAGRPWEALAFGDGAAAMILSTRHRGPFAVRRAVLDTVAELDGCREEIMTIPLAATGPAAPIAHRADLARRWGAHYLAHAVEAVTTGLDRTGLFLCPHQPGRRVIETARTRLGLAPAQVAAINAATGNLSTASVGVAFCHHYARGPAQFPWTVLAAIGTGLTYAAVLLERVAPRTNC